MTKIELKELILRLVPTLQKESEIISLPELLWDAAAVLYVQGEESLDRANDGLILREQIRSMAKNGKLDVTD